MVIEAFLIGTDPFFYSRRVQLATLAARHVIPAAFNAREFVEVGERRMTILNMRDGTGSVIRDTISPPQQGSVGCRFLLART